MLTFLSDPWCKASQMHRSASRSPLMARSSRQDVYSASHSPTQSVRPRKLSRWGDRAVVVLIGIPLGIEGVNLIHYETINVCSYLHFFHVRSINVNAGFPQPVGIAGGRPSTSYYFVGSQADNLFLLGPHHTRTTIPLRPPTQTRERDRGIPNPN
jgi:cysteine protease ATG4